MDITIEQKKHQRIVNQLKRKQISEAISLTQGWIYEHGLSQFSDRLDEIQTIYRNLLTYFGVVDDPEREHIYKKVIVGCLEVADSIFQTIQQIHSTDYYYDKWRVGKRLNKYELQTTLNHLDQALEQVRLYESTDLSKQELYTRISLRKEYERCVSDLYNIAWLTNGTDQTITQQLKEVQTKDYPREVHYMIVVGSLFSLFERYTSNRLQLLIDYIGHPDLSVSQTALTATLITLYFHQWIVESDASLVSRFESVVERDALHSRIQTIIIQLLQSRETEKVTKKLSEDLLPEMVRLSKEVYHKFDIDPNEDDTQQNPEWKSLLDDKRFSNKMQELSQLQMEGADVHMMTFSALKNSTFFGVTCNWFLPYDKKHSSVYPLTTDTTSGKSMMLETIEQSGSLCNSDKYSLCQTILEMPPQAQSMLSYRFADETSELNEQLKNELESEKKQERENLSSQFIRDLYRFSKLFRYKESFPDLFKTRLDVYNVSSVSQLLSNEAKLLVAEFLLKKEYYSEATEIYAELIERNKQIHYELYQKIGFCYYKTGKYSEAVSAFLKAELLESNNTWTIRKIAQCYRLIGEKQKAIDYFLQAETLLPDNLSITFSIGQLYAEVAQYDKALSYFYKVEFIGNESPKILRSIAWTLVLFKRYEKAAEYYDRIIRSTPTAQDYLNAAHAQWLLGKPIDSIECYKQSFRSMNNDKEMFANHYYGDKTLLLEAGIKKNDIFLMLEKVTSDF